MGSAANARYGSKMQDLTVGAGREAGEMCYARGEAFTKGDIVMKNGALVDASVTLTNRTGTDGWKASVSEVVAGTNSVNLKCGDIGVCTADIAQDALGPVAGFNGPVVVEALCYDPGAGATYPGGTPLIATAGQQYLSIAVGAGGSSEKIVARLAFQQAIAGTTETLLIVEFDSNGFGSY